jgi:hypothetical protein
MTMPVTLALQAAALAFALLLSGPTSQPTEDAPKPVVRTSMPADAQRLHCRLYFGCAPAQKVSAVGVKD